jgi:hypothetical protein
MGVPQQTKAPMIEPAGRQLFWFPIIHTPEDLGSVRESVSRMYIRKLGPTQWEQHRGRVEELWKTIRAQIESMGLDYANVRLYQDALPVCGQEAAIVRDLAQQGSLNHALLLDLMSKGAILEGSESPELLVREYTHTRQMLDSLDTPRSQPTPERLQELSRELLHLRDRFIADRIATTLRPGDAGILFLGMLHSLDGLLPNDIALRRIDITQPASARNEDA